MNKMPNTLLFSPATIIKKPANVAHAAADSTAAGSGPDSKQTVRSWMREHRK